MQSNLEGNVINGLNVFSYVEDKEATSFLVEDSGFVDDGTDGPEPVPDPPDAS